VVDTSILPYTIAIHWQFTRPNQTIRFAADEAFATILPYHKSDQANVAVKVSNSQLEKKAFRGKLRVRVVQT
jgi:hypothetical protein